MNKEDESNSIIKIIPTETDVSKPFDIDSIVVKQEDLESRITIVEKVIPTDSVQNWIYLRDRLDLMQKSIDETKKGLNKLENETTNLKEGQLKINIIWMIILGLITISGYVFVVFRFLGQ